jgi:hypothetical protein
MRSLTAICSSLALLAIWATAASAQSGSEFDQYVPGIPAADQDVPLPDALDDDKGGGESEDDGAAAEGPPTGSPSPTSAPGDSSGSGGLDDLAGQGPEGEAVARIADATAPKDAASGPGLELADADGASPGSSLFDLLGGEGGMGGWFPLVLVITLAIAIAYALRRRGA